jgi:hypothetical protein
VIRILLAAFASVTLAATAGTRHVEFANCAAGFTLPSSWSAHLNPSAKDDDSVQCSIALRPRGWSQRAKRSHWGAPDPPLTLFVFKPTTSYEEGLDQIGFEQDEDANHGFGMPGGYGLFATAEPYKAGNLSGLAANTFFRGFIDDERLLDDNESRVFSGDIKHVVLKTRSGRTVAFVCSGDTPDAPVDCEAMMQMIGRSIVIKTPR